jgi:hypothetical protein
MSDSHGRITPLRKGEGPTLLHTEKGNELIKWLNAILSCPELKVSAGKIRIIIPPGSIDPPHAFQLSPSSLQGQPAVRVRYGTFGGLTPTGMSPGDVPPFIIGASASGKVYLTLDVTDNGEPESLAIAVSHTLPASSYATAHIEIGSVSVTNGVVTVAQNLRGSQSYERCGFVDAFSHRHTLI